MVIYRLGLPYYKEFDNFRFARFILSAARCAGFGTLCSPQWQSLHCPAGKHPRPIRPRIRYSSSLRGCSNNRTCGAKVPDHMVRPGCPLAYRYPGPDTTAGTPHHSDNRGQPDLVADDSFCHFGSSPQAFIDFIFYSVGSVSAVTVSPSSFALRRSLPHSGVKK
mgnify:CR=1 FL=1